MNIAQEIVAFFDTLAGKAILLMSALAALDFALGVFRALRDGTFQCDSLASWLRKHIAGRVLPTFAVLIVGNIVGGISIESGDIVGSVLSPGTILTTLGLGMASAYILETISSLKDSLDPAKANPVPTE